MRESQTAAQSRIRQQFLVKRRMVEGQNIGHGILPVQNLAEFTDDTGGVVFAQMRHNQLGTGKIGQGELGEGIEHGSSAFPRRTRGVCLWATGLNRVRRQWFALAGPFGRRLAWSLDGCRGLFRLRQAEVSAATVTQLNVLTLHQSVNGPNGQTHVTTRTDLISNQGNTFLASGYQSFVMDQNGLRD